jgi:hypothetical protein
MGIATETLKESPMKKIITTLALALFALLLAACSLNQWTGHTYIRPKAKVQVLAPNDAAATLMVERALGWHEVSRLEQQRNRAKLVSFYESHQVQEREVRDLMTDVDTEARYQLSLARKRTRQDLPSRS